MSRPEPVYIIAGTLAQAKATAIDRGMAPSPWTREWAYVYDCSVFRGRRDVTVVFGYGATERRDWEELVHWLTALGVEVP